MPITIGFNARLFPTNWRPARHEVAFGAQHGFAAIQFPGPERGLDAERLGDEPSAVGALLADAGIVPVMEIVGRLVGNGRTAAGARPIDLLRANLPAVAALRCRRVHLHLVYLGAQQADSAAASAALPEQFAQGVGLGQQHGFRFGFEHNEPALQPFGEPHTCAAMLAAVPGLGLVFDCNHAPLAQADAFLALAARTTMLHIADTPLPTLNAHLPLGMGNVPLARYLRALIAGGFSGPAILEIGGLPASGGFGRDTDDALIDSAARLRDAIAAAQGR
ncbi:MAG: TIM barrel protein [Chloroflexales bacterium]|nr:TIM barrel protein [Chloroflexales bacterium]